jgi:ankyrin repeat protein
MNNSKREAMLRFLLKQGANPKLQDASQNTVLHALAGQGDAASINVLIEAWQNDKSSLNLQNQWGRTALHIAACKGHADVIRTLVKAGVDVNERCTTTKNTPLHVASTPEAITALLECGADPLRKDDLQRDVLTYLVSSANGLSAQKNANLLRSLIEDKRTTALGAMLTPEYLTNFPIYNRTLLHVAAEAGSQELIRLLKIKGVDILDPRFNKKDFIGKTPSEYAEGLSNEKNIRKVILAELSSTKLTTQAPPGEELVSPEPAQSPAVDSPNSQDILSPSSSKPSTQPSTPMQSAGGSNTHEEKQQTNYPLWIGGGLAVTAIVVSGALWLAQRLKQNQPHKGVLTHVEDSDNK